MSKWSREGNWEMLRAAVTTTREEQIRNLYMQIAEMNKAIAERGDKYATSTEADTINKLSAAIAKGRGLRHSRYHQREQTDPFLATQA